MFMRIIFCLLLVMTACTQQKKFELIAWSKGDIGMHPERASMVNDLLVNHQLIGLNVHQLEQKLGKPDYTKFNSLYYEIETRYGLLRVDPTYTKNLVFDLGLDSLVSAHRIEEWPK